MYSITVMLQVCTVWAAAPQVPQAQLPGTTMPAAGQQAKVVVKAGQAQGARNVWFADPIDMAGVAAAVETLYADQLRPYGRILRKRLNERALQARSKAVHVDIKVLRSSCESCPWLLVQDEEGGDWSALFRGRPEAFINVYSPEDLYPPELWRAAADYFGAMDAAPLAR